MIKTIIGTLSNGVAFRGHTAADVPGAYVMTWVEDPATVTLDAIAGRLPDVLRVDAGPATLGHTDWYFVPLNREAA